VDLITYCHVRSAQQALYGYAVRLAGAWASSTILPLRAVAPERLTEVSGMRTIALPGKGELLREQSHLFEERMDRRGLSR